MTKKNKGKKINSHIILICCKSSVEKYRNFEHLFTQKLESKSPKTKFKSQKVENSIYMFLTINQKGAVRRLVCNSELCVDCLFTITFFYSKTKLFSV